MPVPVLIPQRLIGGKAERQAEGKTLREVMKNLIEQDAEFSRLLDDQGELRGSVNVYVNEEDARFLQKLDTPIHADDIVMIVPASHGG